MLRDISLDPRVQSKVQLELETEIGEADLRLEKISSLQYLTACFYETLRTTSSAIVPHMANRDTTIGGMVNHNITYRQEMNP